jgi:accessory colonization factor AcfC
MTPEKVGEKDLHAFATGSTTGPLRRAAQAFVLQEDVNLDVTVGGSDKLASRMCESRQGDLFCGGCGASMDVAMVFGAVLSDSIQHLGARETVILVPNGNPAEIENLRDLTRRDVRLGVSSQGSLSNLWEEVALRADMFQTMSKRITSVSIGSSELITVLARREVDASIGWASMAMLAPERVEMVPIPPEWCSWRVTSIGVTPWSANRELAKRFIDFLVSTEGQQVFHKFGWKPIEAAKVPMRTL